MSTPVSYLLCGTPRTGSTLLCSLLSSTGVLGHPESYFREPDEAAWAARFGLPIDGLRVCDYTAFVQAVRGAGTTENGVFAARLMWGSVERMMRGLAEQRGQADLVTLEAMFGRLAFVYVWREDIVAQAVSWCRAEQTGFWQEGDIPLAPPEQDVERMTELVCTIGGHNAAWQSWFERQGVQPYGVTYEQLVNDPRTTVEGLAAHLGVKIPPRWRPTSPHRKQADEISGDWATALRTALKSQAG